MKTQIGKYIKGKLTQDELVNRNRSYLKRLYHIRQNYEVLKQNLETLEFTQARKRLFVRNSMSSMRSLTTLPQEETKYMNNLVYALLLDDYLICYVPANGQKRIQRLGGKEETFNNSPASQQQPLYLTIHLLRNVEEYLRLMVSPAITLDKLLRHLANKTYWDTDEVRKSSPFIRSFSKTSQSMLKHKPKFLERSKNFHNELTGLLSLLDYGATGRKAVSKKGMTTAQLTQIGFAKRTYNMYDSSPVFTRLSVTVTAQTTIAQCFTSHELATASEKNPLSLFLFLSSSNMAELSRSDNLPAGANRTVMITEDMLTYLASLITKDLPDEPEPKDIKKVITEMTESIFAMLEDVMPSSNSPGAISVAKPLVHCFIHKSHPIW